MVSRYWAASLGTVYGAVLSGTYNQGVRLRVDSPCYLVDLGYYAYAAGALYKASAVALWDESTGGKVAEWLPSGDPGAAGWQYGTISPAVLLQGAHNYRVAATLGAGQTQAYVDPVGTVAPDSPISVPSGNKGCYIAGTGYPDTTHASAAWLADVGISLTDPGGGGGGATPGDVDAALAEWLSADLSTQTHETDGLPYLTKTAVDAIRDGYVRGTRWTDAAIGWLNDRSSQAVDFLNGVSSSAVSALNGLSASIVSILNDIAGVKSDTATLRDATGFPSPPWSLLAETDFTGQVAWAQPADRYVLTVTDANGAVAHDVDGVPWYPRLGWWTALDGTQANGRSFCEFGASQLQDGGRRMPGVLIKFNDGLIQAHLQAWALT